MRPFGITRLGTQVRLPDGRDATVVYNGLEGVGVKLGLHDPPETDFEGTSGGCLANPPLPINWPWRPDLLLRCPWFDGRKCCGWTREQCICEEADVEILRVGMEVEE